MLVVRRMTPARTSKAAGTKLSPTDVRKIRRLWERGRLTQGEIAERFGVHQVTVSSIVRGATWSHVA